MSRQEAAVRFALSHRAVASAIVGFATPEEVRQTVEFAALGPLDGPLLARLNEFAFPLPASGS